MSTSATTGFCRVTVVAPDSRIDVALPEDIPLADVYPEVLRISGQIQDEGAPAGYHLVRRDGSVLDSSLPLAAQQVRDGDVLSLRPFAESLAPAVYDDVADAIATAVSDDSRTWASSLMGISGLIGASVLLVLLGLALWFSNLQHNMHSLPGVLAALSAVLLLALSGIRSRVYEDKGSAIALGLAALPHAMIAGSGAFDFGQTQLGPGRVQFLTGSIAVLLASVLLVALLPDGDAPFVSAAFASVIGTLAAFGMVLTSASAREVAACAGVVAVGVIGFLPALSARFARLPVAFQSPQQGGAGRRGEPTSAAAFAEEYDSVAARARRGHELLVGLVGGCAAVIVGSAVVLGFVDSAWPEWTALALGLATMLRARLFQYRAQVLCLLVAGISSIALLVLGLSLHMPRYIQEHLMQNDSAAVSIRTVWLAAAIAAGAAILVAIGLVVPKRGVSPFWGRLLDIVDGLTLAALIPLALAVVDVYGTVRGFTS
ncbi:type VII secretion integral membrane protein EccD [Phaeacidiphilus oryzae]|uniref:type VII secretion integral membrane protein EccD n=1 Tax=Phaeacidiphilus oryzae TaxID=348818 RepID=UPI0005678392|nr:type VII secretion integral membrane protein EccD [Phaeacidiphilus oryzae]